MAALSESLRKATTFLLAVFLWLHALFFLNFQSAFVFKCAQLLRLTTSEVVLFGLLVIFSFVTGSGFWKTLRSLVYIYAFPFVLVWYTCYACFLVLRALHRWFKSQANSQPHEAVTVIPQATRSSAPVGALPASSDNRTGTGKRAMELLLFLVRPFRRFTFLWCFLLLVTTHVGVLWLSLGVVLLHLVRKIFGILKIVLFSGPWLGKIGTGMRTGINTAIDTALAGLAVVTRESAPTNELRNLWNQLQFLRKAVNFLGNEYLVSRWVWVLGIVFLGCVYLYIALLFSFVYYGVARVGGVAYSWPEAAVTSLFIPFLISDLPKIVAVRLLGGIHCTLIVTVGIGTILNYFRRRLESIRTAATIIGDRLTDPSFREKYLILEERFSTDPTDALPTDVTKK